MVENIKGFNRLAKKPVVLIVAFALFLTLILGLNYAKAGVGSWWDGLQDKVADRLAQQLGEPSGEEAIGSTGESLSTRNVTGLFDETLKDSDGSDGGTRLVRRFISDTLYTAASTTFLSIQNTTGQVSYVCRSGMRLFASSTNARPVGARWSIGSSTITGTASTTAFNGGVDDKSIFGYSLASSTDNGQVSNLTLTDAGAAGSFSGRGNVVSSTSANSQTLGVQSCVPIENGAYTTGLFRVETPNSMFSADATGYASSSFYWLEIWEVPTSS